MNKLRENLYIGNITDATSVEGLRKAHITCVFNTAYEVIDPLYHPSEIRYVKIGLLDSTENRKDIRQLAIEILIRLLKNKETVLVHCGAGLSRAPFVACHALSVIEKKDPEEILQEIRNERPFALRSSLWLDFGYKPIGYEEEIDNEEESTILKSRKHRRKEVKHMNDQLEQQMQDLRAKKASTGLTPEEETVLNALLALDEDQEDVDAATAAVATAQAAVNTTAQQALDNANADLTAKQTTLDTDMSTYQTAQAALDAATSGSGTQAPPVDDGTTPS